MLSKHSEQKAQHTADAEPKYKYPIVQSEIYPGIAKTLVFACSFDEVKDDNDEYELMAAIVDDTLKGEGRGFFKGKPISFINNYPSSDNKKMMLEKLIYVLDNCKEVLDDLDCVDAYETNENRELLINLEVLYQFVKQQLDWKIRENEINRIKLCRIQNDNSFPLPEPEFKSKRREGSFGFFSTLEENKLSKISNQLLEVTRGEKSQFDLDNSRAASPVCSELAASTRRTSPVSCVTNDSRCTSISRTVSPIDEAISRYDSSSAEEDESKKPISPAVIPLFEDDVFPTQEDFLRGESFRDNACEENRKRIYKEIELQEKIELQNKMDLQKIQQEEDQEAQEAREELYAIMHPNSVQFFRGSPQDRSPSPQLSFDDVIAEHKRTMGKIFTGK